MSNQTKHIKQSLLDHPRCKIKHPCHSFHLKPLDQSLYLFWNWYFRFRKIIFLPHNSLATIYNTIPQLIWLACNVHVQPLYTFSNNIPVISYLPISFVSVEKAWIQCQNPAPIIPCYWRISHKDKIKTSKMIKLPIYYTNIS